MTDEIRTESGELIRARTKKMGVTIARQRYGSGDVERYSSTFYYAKMVNGELARFPLSSDAKEAERRADQIAAFLEDPTHTLADARRRFNPRALLRGSAFSTIGEVFDYHKEHWKVLSLGKDTGPDYQKSLLYVMRRVDAWRRGVEVENWNGMHGESLAKKQEPWLEKPATILTAKLLMDFQRVMVPPDLEDEEEEITAKISCDKYVRSAKAVFSKDALRLYKASDTITLPDLSDFLAVSLFGAKKYFSLPSVKVIKEIFREAGALRREDENAYRAFLICVQAGLRKSEAANFRLAWMHDEDDPVIRIHEDGKFKPKHGHGRRVVLDTWVRDEINAIAASTDGFFLAGSETERNETVFERLNIWLRKRGVDATKPTHELRKLWFSQKVKREGLLAAAQQGGHEDPKVTKSFYADNQMPAVVIPFWTKPTDEALFSLGEQSA